MASVIWARTLTMTEQIPDTDFDLLNREFLSERFPKHVELFSRIESKYSIEYQDDGIFFKTQAGRYLLRQPDHEYSKMRVNAFLERPPRLSMVSKAYGADSVKDVWDAHIRDADLTADDKRWAKWPSILESQGLIVFDVGCLNTVIALIDDELKSLKSVRIFITDFDFFFARLKLENWVDFFDYFDSREIAIDLVFVKGQQEIISSLRQFVWSKHLIFPDNILCYFHFAGSPQKALWRAIRYEYTSLISGLGFFDDEMEMFAHSHANIVSQKGNILSLKRKTKFGRAIVVGSGPSLDKSIIENRHLFDNSFVVAAGTAVEPLLHAGIDVDICVILERGKALIAVYEEMSQRVDLTKVNLVASSTVAPGLSQFFSSAAFFFRPGLNVHAGFGADQTDTLYGCDPTVSNTAVALCASLNFGQCLLIGVDMGSTDVAHHHSKNSTYHTGTTQFGQKFNLPATANFGGPAVTGSVLHWARQCLETLVRSRYAETQTLNCSDGVEIAYAPSILPGVVGDIDRYFPPINLKQPRVMEIFVEYDTTRMAYDIGELDELIASLEYELEKFNWNDRAELGCALYDLLWSSANRKAWPMIIRGSLYLLIWHAYSVLSRLTPSQREDTGPIFCGALRAAVTYMVEKIRSDVREASNCDPHASEPVGKASGNKAINKENY